MEIREIRRVNLRALVIEYGSIRKLAASVGSSESYLSQLLSPRIDAGMGDHLARQIEAKLGRSPGWMDNRHDIIADVRWLELRSLCGEKMNKQQKIPAPPDVGEQSYFSEANSNAMAPVIGAGDLLVIDPEAAPVAGRIVVASVPSMPDPVVRRLECDGGVWCLRAEGGGFPALTLDGLVGVHGVVVMVIKRV